MTIKKLVAKDFEIEEEKTIVYEAGEVYSYFVDEETGKFYRPIDSFEVTGEDLDLMFVEVPAWIDE